MAAPLTGLCFVPMVSVQPARPNALSCFHVICLTIPFGVAMVRAVTVIPHAQWEIHAQRRDLSDVPYLVNVLLQAQTVSTRMDAPNVYRTNVLRESMTACVLPLRMPATSIHRRTWPMVAPQAHQLSAQQLISV